MTFNAAEPDRIREERKKDKRAEAQRAKDFRFIMEHPEGRRFVADMLDFCGFQRSSFTGNSGTFFNEGMRLVALDLWARINEVAPDLYFDMLKDAQRAGQKESNT